MKKLYILKVGTTFPAILDKFEDFDSWTLKGLGEVKVEICILDAEHGDIFPDVKDCAGLIITGSHSMVTENLPWSVRIEKWIPLLLEYNVPILGICYGHQLLAKATGGRVNFHRIGKEIGTVHVNLLEESYDDPLFKSFPQSFPAHAVHSQTIRNLPPQAICLAANTFEPNHIFRLGDCAWGVQFHPEYNADIMRAYIEEQSVELTSEGIDVQKILSEVEDTSIASATLRNFALFVEGKLTNSFDPKKRKRDQLTI